MKYFEIDFASDERPNCIYARLCVVERDDNFFTVK